MMYETEGLYALDGDPPVWNDYRASLQEAGVDLDLEPIDKWDFYPEVSTADHVLTSKQQISNALLICCFTLAFVWTTASEHFSMKTRRLGNTD